MADGKAVFHVDHANLAASGAVPDVAGLSAGRLAMRSQLDGDGVTPFAVTPKYLVVAPKNETLGEQLLATIAATATNQVNPFGGRLQLLVDPRLSANPWYLFGDAGMSPPLEYAYLNGAVGPQIEQRDGWDTGISAEDAYAELRGGGPAIGGVDRDVSRVYRESAGNIDKLATSLARLAQTTRPDLKSLALDVSSQAGAAIISQRENDRLRKELAGLAGDTTAVRDATDKATKAHDRTTRAVRGSGAAHAEARKALVDFAAVARDLEQSYDPRASALTRYREELLKIAGARGAGAINAEQAARYRQGALSEGLRAFPLVAPETDAQKRARDDEQARADFIAQTLDRQRGGIEIAQRELALVGETDAVRAREIDKLNLILDLKRRGIDPTSAEGQQLINNLAVLDATEAKLRLAEDRTRNLQRIGENAIDRIFDARKPEDFLNIIEDIGKELLKLALLDPLKDLFKGAIGGGNGIVAGDGNGGFDIFGAIFGSIFKIFGLASGTEYARGGMALVGEHGPERVFLPTGSKVVSAPNTRRMLEGEARGSGGVTIVQNMTNNFAGGAATKQDVVDMGQAAAKAAYDAVIERERRKP